MAIIITIIFVILTFYYLKEQEDMAKTIGNILNKKVCYKCGKKTNKGDYYPVAESPKDVECPPKMWFCDKCLPDLDDRNPYDD